MSAPPPDRNNRVICIPGRSFQCVGDLVVGDDGGRLEAWSIDTGVLRWRAEDHSRFTLVGDEVHALAGDEVPTLRVLDVQSGALLRERPSRTSPPSNCPACSRCATARTSSGPRGCSSGARSPMARCSRRRRSQASHPRGPSRPSWVSPLGTGAVAAFATDTLARLWLRQGFDEPDLRAAGDVIVVSGQDDEEAGSNALLALDARTGQTRWHNGVFGWALACSEEAVLACDHFGWVAALDARTGEVRWRQCVGSPPRDGVRVEEASPSRPGHDREPVGRR